MRNLPFPLIMTVAVVAVPFVALSVWSSHEAKARFSSLSESDRNLAVFDAGVAAIAAHYYDPQFLETQEWRDLVAKWRAESAKVKPNYPLYQNQLRNFAREFPDSHVWFSEPPIEKPSATSARPASAPGNRIVDEYRSGPGFELVTIRRKAGQFNVVGDVLRGSPAERAGVTPGWWLLTSNTDTIGDDLHFHGTFLRLPVDVAIASDDAPLFPGVRTQAQLDAYLAANSVRIEYAHEVLPAREPVVSRTIDGLTYLRFDEFSSDDGFDKVLDGVDAASQDGLVLDLRGNTGGRSFSMQKLLGRLLGSNVEIGANQYVEKSGRQVLEDLRTVRIGSHYEGPLAVLIGPLTASAGEITAGVVQAQKRGIVIGRATNGSVVSAQLFDLPDGGHVMVPVRNFLLGGSRRLEDLGVKPDRWVVPTLEDVRAGRDPALELAVDTLKRRHGLHRGDPPPVR